MRKLELIKKRLKDERCGEVIFLSHCLMNMNARYMGGAFRESCVSELIHGAIDRNISMIQIKCPEQRAWGGILKPLMWIAFDSRRLPLYQLRCIVLPIFRGYTKLCYRRYAKELVREISDYKAAGYRVVGMIGIDGSPTCGVKQHIDLEKAFQLYTRSKVKELNREEFNRSLYHVCLAEGRGIFIDQVKKRLDKKAMNIPIYAHSLIDESNRKTNSLWEVIK